MFFHRQLQGNLVVFNVPDQSKSDEGNTTFHTKLNAQTVPGSRILFRCTIQLPQQPFSEARKRKREREREMKGVRLKESLPIAVVNNKSSMAIFPFITRERAQFHPRRTFLYFSIPQLEKGQVRQRFHCSAWRWGRSKTYSGQAFPLAT